MMFRQFEASLPCVYEICRGVCYLPEVILMLGIFASVIYLELRLRSISSKTV